ncbi:MAG: RDD family protein [Acidobacteriota bacterium]
MTDIMIMVAVFGFPFIIGGLILILGKMSEGSKKKAATVAKPVMGNEPTEGTAIDRPSIPESPPIQARPFERLWARSFDYAIMGIVVIILQIFLLILGINTLYTLPLGFALLPTFLLWIPVEAGCLATWGMTPGKWIWQIRVLDNSGHLLTFGAALKRSFLVFVLGVGFGNVVLGALTQVYWLFKMTSRRPEPTYWDRSSGAIVAHKEPGLARLMLLGVFYVIYQVLMGIVRMLGAD